RIIRSTCHTAGFLGVTQTSPPFIRRVLTVTSRAETTVTYCHLLVSVGLQTDLARERWPWNDFALLCQQPPPEVGMGELVEE
ncbi:hypothetical protein KUCAC02_020923, partial [Chaenocephalus aceratus]